jgi:hypothetical protein
MESGPQKPDMNSSRYLFASPLNATFLHGAKDFARLFMRQKSDQTLSVAGQIFGTYDCS